MDPDVGKKKDAFRSRVTQSMRALSSRNILKNSKGRTKPRNASVATSTPFLSEKRSWWDKLQEDELLEEVKKWKHTVAAKLRVSAQPPEDSKSGIVDYPKIPEATRASYESLGLNLCLLLLVGSILITFIPSHVAQILSEKADILNISDLLKEELWPNRILVSHVFSLSLSFHR